MGSFFELDFALSACFGQAKAWASADWDQFVVITDNVHVPLRLHNPPITPKGESEPSAVIIPG
jgi:hypothetical protein